MERINERNIPMGQSWREFMVISVSIFCPMHPLSATLGGGGGDTRKKEVEDIDTMMNEEKTEEEEEEDEEE